MKKLRYLLSVAFLFLHCSCPLYADGLIVVTSPDFLILEEEHAHEVRSIASISKIMTALVALEYGDYNDIWIVKEEIKYCTGSMIWLLPNQKVSMRSLLYGMMLKSGNDAATAIAYHVGGNNTEHFIELMNKKAQEIGMKDTVFHNPHGLDVQEEGNQSTAYDMALLMNEALKNELFRELIHTQHYQSEWGISFTNSNKLLGKYPYMLGGKTGYTQKAGETLVTAADDADSTVIVVTLNVSNRYEVHRSFYERYLSELSRYELLAKGKTCTSEGCFILDEPFYVTCSKAQLNRSELRYERDLQADRIIVSWLCDGQAIKHSYAYTEHRS